jgi:hypothetical protein
VSRSLHRVETRGMKSHPHDERNRVAKPSSLAAGDIPAAWRRRRVWRPHGSVAAVGKTL